MSNIPSRDINGRCEGECRNLVREGEVERQNELKDHEYSGSPSSSPEWTRSRTEQPGIYGGHV
ncbi:hypothetical protein [Desulfospira joergensenii]|uniref:hypothetical protein n=1 Tax=Desulfospira joergensenii TaxID=53329 RepID=UPI000413553D|nr:hypothetical protein [Desulfospira joergensenii]